MQRAAVLIGVKKAGNLPELQAVSPRIRELTTWAQSQGISTPYLKVLTDEAGEVRIHQITDAIEELVTLGTIEQLIIYFTGHGVNNRGDYWLLSRAPDNSNEAVNVEGSLLLARYCGIPHVVTISDACRTAADGIQAQHLTGGEIFPSETGANEEFVDVFFSCARGKPSLEVKDPNVAAAEFSAMYTDELIACLKGERPGVLENLEVDGVASRVTRAWPLDDHLSQEVPRLIQRKLGKAARLNQTPVARITSRNAWLSQLPANIGKRPKRRPRSDSAIGAVAHAPLLTPYTASNQLISAALQGGTEHWLDAFDQSAAAPEVALLKQSIANFSKSPTVFETNCGFKILGARVNAAVSNAAQVEILNQERTHIRVGGLKTRTASVLLELQNGTGVLVPAIGDFIGELSFEDNEFVNLTYDPSAGTYLWREYQARRDEIRNLRALIAAAAGFGVFRLDGHEAPLSLAKRMQFVKGIDPSMGLYAAYAYHDLRRKDLITQMQSFMADKLKLVLFDITMLAGKVGATTPHSPTLNIEPPFPMLSQGWSLLPAFRIKLPRMLGDLPRHLLPSLWTMFDATGVKLLKSAINSGNLH